MVVQLLGLYESSLQSVLVTEYLSGGDLVTRYMIVYGHRVPLGGDLVTRFMIVMVT